MLLEKKWLTASNMSSLTHMSDLITAKKRCKTSALGYAIVSHNDIDGVNRLQNYGKFFFNLDDGSDYDDIEQNTSPTFMESKALVPWTHEETYEIPKGTQFFTAGGISFLSLATVSSRILKEPYSVIRHTPNKYSSFLEAGGWDGIKYLKVPVIQGTLQNTSLGVAKGQRFETFILNDPLIENASNTLSAQYFKIIVQSTQGAKLEEEWVEVPNIRIAGPYDKVFEKTLLTDNSGIAIKFGDGITGWMIPKNSLVRCQYLETLGDKGNINLKYQLNRMVFPANQPMRDPRTNSISNFLTCTNINMLKGGKDFESEDEFKISAPTNYRKSYATATTADYEYQIMENSPLSLLHLRCFPSVNIASKPYVTADLEDEEISNQITVLKKTLAVTAILSSGDKIQDPYNSFILPITQFLGAKKGPNDFFEFIQPNYIQLAAGVKIKSNDTSITEEDIFNQVQLQILDKYSIFDTSFKQPFYSSDLIHIGKNFKFADAAELTLEALADVYIDQTKIKLLMLDNGPTHENTGVFREESGLILIPFSFNQMYAQKLNEIGFKNYKQQASYVIKADIRFINGPAFNALNRTLFLFDHRDEEDGRASTLEDAKGMVIDSQGLMPEKLNFIFSNDIGNMILYNEFINGYSNRQVRVGQFPYIKNITNNEFMFNANSFNKEPYEIRPYMIDQNSGDNQVFEISDVGSSQRVSISGDREPINGNLCYKRNLDYVKNLSIIFNENYDKLGSALFASGYIMLPTFYLKIGQYLNNVDETFLIEAITNLIKDTVEIKIFAQPIMTNLEPTNENDIIFIDDSDIKVEKA